MSSKSISQILGMMGEELERQKEASRTHGHTTITIAWHDGRAESIKVNDEVTIRRKRQGAKK